MALHIKSIDPQKMVLDDDSEWQPLPSLEFSSSWKIGDEIVSEKKGERFSLWRLINNTRKQETGAVPINAPGDISKSLGKSGSEEEYTNLDKEIKIKKASGELIWLKDDSKWQMYNPTPWDPGLWEVGGAVIVTQRAKKSMESKLYQMENVETRKSLMAIFLGYER